MSVCLSVCLCVFVSVQSEENQHPTHPLQPVSSSDLASFSRQFQTMTVAANRSFAVVQSHAMILQSLVGGTANCPALIFLYPKNMSLGYRLRNIGKTFFQDVMMMSVVCPETLKMVRCGPDGAGWEVTNPKRWVKKWGPALLCAIKVFQVAAVAGRMLGFPIPTIPSARDIGLDTGQIQKALGSLWDTYVAEGLCDGMQWAKDGVITAQSAASMDTNSVESFHRSSIVRLSGEAYKRVQLFLTTGDNLQLGGTDGAYIWR